MTSKIKQYKLKTNGHFGLIKGPYDKEQHPNQRCGLDKYVTVLNIHTSEICVKKLYRTKTKGLCFKHTGLPPSYLSDLTGVVLYTPYQIEILKDAD